VDPHGSADGRRHHDHQVSLLHLQPFASPSPFQPVTLLLLPPPLLTIPSNIGHNVQALWTHFSPSATKPFIAHAQLLHVSILSLGSFTGRLASGIGSDFIVKRLHASRFWCVIVAACIFAVDQLAATRIQDPNYLWVVSGLCGLAYGVTFGVLPAVVVDTFGPGEFVVLDLETTYADNGF
jgi:MFS family permease